MNKINFDNSSLKELACFRFRFYSEIRSNLFVNERPKVLSPLNALKTINKEAVENEITMTEIMFIILITDFSFLEKKYFKAK